MNEASVDAAFGRSESFASVDYRMAITVTRFAYMPGSEAMTVFAAEFADAI